MKTKPYSKTLEPKFVLINVIKVPSVGTNADCRRNWSLRPLLVLLVLLTVVLPFVDLVGMLPAAM